MGRRAPLPNRNSNTSRHSLAPLGSRKLPGVKTAITTAKKGSSTIVESTKKSTKTAKNLPPSGKQSSINASPVPSKLQMGSDGGMSAPDLNNFSGKLGK